MTVRAPDTHAFMNEVEIARKAWPELDADPKAFVAFLVELGPSGQSPDQSKAGLYVSDLYLAFACLAGDRRAHAELARWVRRVSVAAVEKIRSSRILPDDVFSLAMQALLMGVGGGTPKLAQYCGRGALCRWLEVVALRLALNADQTRRWEVPLGDVVFDGLRSETNSEIDYLKSHYSSEVRAAIHEALSALPVRKRTLLRYRFVDNLPIAAICAIYDVHRATVMRWLGEVRTSLRAGVQQRLRERLKLSAADVDSVIGLVISRLEASMRQLVGSA